MDNQVLMSNVENYLNQRRVNSNEKYTHVSMGDKFVGKFYVKDNSEFLKIYYKAISNGCVFNIAEKPLEYGPVIVDIDLELEKEKYTNGRLYNDEMITEVINKYRNCISDYVSDDVSLDVSVFLKPNPTHKEHIIKDGFHLIFHNVTIHYKLRYLIREKVIKILDSDMFKHFKNDIDKIVDKAVINTNCWLLPKSKKKDGYLYELDAIYDEDNEEIDNEYNEYQLLKLYSLQNKIRRKDLSSELLEHVTDEYIDHEYDNLFNSHNIENKSKNTDIDIEKVKLCLECCDADCDYDSWVKIGMTLKNICGSSGLELFLDWSSKSYKFNKNECIQKYNSFKIDGELSFGTLVFYAKQFNEELYNTLNQEYNKSIYEFNFYEFNTYTVATHFKSKYSDKFIYQNNKIYYFNGVYWKSEDKKNMSSLNLFLSGEYFNYLYNLLNKFEELELKKNSSNTQSIIEKISKIRLLLSSLRDYEKRQKFISEILLTLNNNDIKFDEKPYLFAFNNKIYDLEQSKFIEPKAEHYISLTCGYEFNGSENAESEKENINEVFKLIDTIFPDKEIRDFYLTILSTTLDGVPLEKFIIANGCGGNGKGVLHEFLFSLLGDYSYVLPSLILLSPLKDNGNVSVANMNKKRLVLTREPDSKQQIICSTVKEFTGGEEINARLLYSNDTKTKLTNTFIMECNDKPKLDEVNKAIQRRIIDIPFKNSFVDKSIYDLLEEDEKVNTYITNHYYKTNEFKLKYRKALFFILSKYHKEFMENKRILNIPKEILQKNNEYLEGSDSMLQWFKDNFQKTDNSKDILKLKNVYQLFKTSEYFNNCNKQQKRDSNYKNFVSKLETNIFLKKYVCKDRKDVYIIKNHISKVIDNDSDDEIDNDI